LTVYCTSAAVSVVDADPSPALKSRTQTSDVDAGVNCRRLPVTGVKVVLVELKVETVSL
jgi:hypothetical protein